MPASRPIAVSDLLRARVRHSDGSDRGLGHQIWMHPPCHRVLGWSCRPATFGPRRTVWRLDQLLSLDPGEAVVRGEPASTDQESLDLLPTLLEADLTGRNGQPLGRLVDAVVERDTGRVLHYLVARSDPRLPGTSRWRLDPDRILDQRPGQVEAALQGLDDLPLDRAGVREQVLSRSRRWRDGLRERMGSDDDEGFGLDGVEERLRGWGERLRDSGEELIGRLRDDEPRGPSRRPAPRARPADEDEDPWI